MERTLTRREASDAVGAPGWRYVLGVLRTHAAVRSMTQAVGIAAPAVAACGVDADGHLGVDVRAERVVLALRSAEHATVTDRDVELARRVSDAVGEAKARTGPDVSPGGGRLLADTAAPAFWVLADPGGNEACVTTWQGGD